MRKFVTFAIILS